MKQHMEALARANQIRIPRAALRRRIKCGEVSVTDLLNPEAALPPETVSMPILELLEAQHNWGRKRSLRVLGRLTIREKRRLDALTRRERYQLVQALAGVTEASS